MDAGGVRFRPLQMVAHVTINSIQISIPGPVPPYNLSTLINMGSGNITQGSQSKNMTIDSTIQTSLHHHKFYVRLIISPNPPSHRVHGYLIPLPTLSITDHPYSLSPQPISPPRKLPQPLQNLFPDSTIHYQPHHLLDYPPLHPASWRSPQIIPLTSHTSASTFPRSVIKPGRWGFWCCRC